MKARYPIVFQLILREIKGGNKENFQILFLDPLSVTNFKYTPTIGGKEVLFDWTAPNTQTTGPLTMCEINQHF